MASFRNKLYTVGRLVMPGRSIEFEVLLDDLRTALENLYGDRLVLYGSQSKTITASTVILRVEYAISKFPNCGPSFRA